jgi:hypothetical protein
MTPGAVTADEGLPFVDQHRQRVDGPAEAVWRDLLGGLRRELSGGSRLAWLLGADPAVATAGFTGRSGDALPGFRVVDAEPGRRLVLAGRHRFARYRLTFLVGAHGLIARTEAAFPGLHGRIYRALVIGSGAHGWVTRQMLRRLTGVG